MTAQDLLHANGMPARTSRESSGQEGLADVRVVNAIYDSAEIGRAVQIESVSKEGRTDETMQIKRTSVKQQEMIEAGSPRIKTGQKCNSSSSSRATVAARLLTVTVADYEDDTNQNHEDHQPKQIARNPVGTVQTPLWAH